MDQKQMEMIAKAIADNLEKIVPGAVETAVEEKMKEVNLSENADVKEIKGQIKDLVEQMKMSSGVKTEDEEKEKAVKIMATFAKSLKKGNSVQVAAKEAWDVADIQNELIDGEGGFLVPEQFMRGIIDKLGKFGIARREGTTIPMSRDTYNMKNIASLPEVYYADEGKKGTKSKVDFGNEKLSAKKVIGLLGASLELIEDSTPDYDVWDILMKAITKAIMKFEDENFFKEITKNTNVNIIVADGNAKTISLDNLFDMIYDLDENFIESENDLKFYGTRNVLKVLKSIKDNDGRPIFGIDGKEKTILWYPFETVPTGIKGVSAGNDEAVLVFGDLKAVFFGDRKKITLDLGFADGDFERGTQTLRAISRHDIKVAYPKALSVLKTHA